MPLDQVDVKNTPKVEKEMTFLQHLEELRWHLIRAVIAVFAIAIMVFLAKSWVLKIVFGPTQPDFITYEIICQIITNFSPGSACLRPIEINFITPNFGEKFITYLKISIILGLVAAFPYVFWEFWRFISPGLYDTERKAARGVVFVCSALFMLGVSFGYFVIAPFAVTFLTSFEIEGIDGAYPAFSSYVNYLIMFTLPVGIVFELPVVVFFLSKVGLITPEFMKQYRRHAFVIILIAAAAITPPDVITQILIALPLYILYEISITISRRVVKKQQELFEREGL